MNDVARSARPFDSGLQPERTALAWQRTALSIAIGALVGERLLTHAYGAWAMVAGGIGLAFAILIMIGAHRRHTTTHLRLTTADSDRIPLPDGTLPALLGLVVLGAGAMCLLVVLTWRSAA